MAQSQTPFIVGEFGFQHGQDRQGNPIPIPFETLLSDAGRLGFGYLAWSWTGSVKKPSTTPTTRERPLDRVVTT